MSELAHARASTHLFKHTLLTSHVRQRETKRESWWPPPMLVGAGVSNLRSIYGLHDADRNGSSQRWWPVGDIDPPRDQEGPHCCKQLKANRRNPQSVADCVCFNSRIPHNKKTRRKKNTKKDKGQAACAFIVKACMFALCFRPWTHTSDDSYIYHLSLGCSDS